MELVYIGNFKLNSNATEYIGYNQVVELKFKIPHSSKTEMNDKLSIEQIFLSILIGSMETLSKRHDQWFS